MRAFKQQGMMKPTLNHTVDEHGTIHAPAKGLSKREWRKLKRKGIRPANNRVA